MTEQQLIIGCKNKDPKAQEMLYNLYAPKMMAVCMRYADNRAAAEDWVQDGFVRAFSAIDSYSQTGSFEGWMRRIFVNTALEQLRRNDVMKDSYNIDDVPFEHPVGDSALEQISAQELVKIIETLPTGFRTVLNMYAIEGYSHKEIAEALQITESTSRSQYTRAKKLLQKRIEDLL